ncbi:MAG: helix-turn-helix transcriptional regulator [Prolixibacteraceae bacterium]|jgi:transcriptional regulator with XRE-family HTH domain|nr:helix-turn-helix transcriptional regulator [Prolixibacteraceae bacterium]
MREIFGIHLQQLRKENGMTQERLAELADLDVTYISLLERGKRQPTLHTLEKVAKAFEIKTWQLVEYIETKL